MPETWRVRAPDTLGADRFGALCLMNQPGSGKQVTVRKVSVENLSFEWPNPDRLTFSTTASNVGLGVLARISSIAGGEQITPTPMDSSVSLPSGVKVYQGGRVEIASIFGQQGLVGRNTGPNISSQVIPQTCTNGGKRGLSAVRVCANTGINAPITLQAGEGISLLNSTECPSIKFVYTLVFVTGGGTFTATCWSAWPCTQYPQLSVFNELGSGVTVSLVFAGVTDVNDHGIISTTIGNNPPWEWVVVRIKGWKDDAPGVEIAPVPMSSASAALPASVVARNGASPIPDLPPYGSLLPDGGGTGVQLNMASVPLFMFGSGPHPSIFRHIQHYSDIQFPSAVSNTFAGAIGHGPKNWKVHMAPMTLNPGEGIAVVRGLQGTAGYLSNADAIRQTVRGVGFATVTFDVAEAPASGGATGMVMARVRSGY